MPGKEYSPHHASLTRFDRHFFDGSHRFTYMGSGELGGKAHGLARMKTILESKPCRSYEPDISITIPTLSVITTEFFDLFMKENNLFDIAYSGDRDDLIAHAFQKATLPVRLVGDLRSLVEQVHSPLAIRSSSLLEDAMFEPFASVYATKMVSNNQPDADSRFRKLSEAIKFVYASTFFKSAGNYMKATHHATIDEKMAVIVQEIVGTRFDTRFYPHISGVMRSYNFYPTGNARPGEGIVELALGLGRTIVDEGVSWAFSPAWPQANPPFKSIGDMLKNSQTGFWAVNMGAPPVYNPILETEYLVRCGIEDGEYDGTLRHIASTYLPYDERIEMGIEAAGPRVLDFSPILKAGVIPLTEVLRTVLKLCEDTIGTMVEIEFAMTLEREYCSPAHFGFLQVRPMVVSDAKVEVPEEELSSARAVLASKTVLGNGTLGDITDILYVDPERFDAAGTGAIAKEIERFNRELTGAKKPYILIGFGRWGTTDPSGGIPVDFSQISGAKVIVEASLPDMNFNLSQGSHFFHNVTSFRIFYFSVQHDGEYLIDWKWLDSQPPAATTEHVRHVRLDRPLEIRVDGRSGRGVILHE